MEQVVELSIVLTGEMYSDNLDDPGSLQYQTLSRQLADKVRRLKNVLQTKCFELPETLFPPIIYLYICTPKVFFFLQKVAEGFANAALCLLLADRGSSGGPSRIQECHCAGLQVSLAAFLFAATENDSNLKRNRRNVPPCLASSKSLTQFPSARLPADPTRTPRGESS